MLWKKQIPLEGLDIALSSNPDLLHLGSEVKSSPTLSEPISSLEK